MIARLPARTHRRPGRARQRGATLAVALIFLVLMSLFAVSAFLGSSTNLRVVGNMQVRQEALAAAQVAIEQTISGIQFAEAPAAVAGNPVNVDTDGNSVTDYVVRMTPQPACYRVKPIKNSELNVNVAADLTCIRSGVVTNPGQDATEAAALADNSLCANTEWNLRAEVTDARTGAVVAVNQGVAVRVLDADAATYCK